MVETKFRVEGLNVTYQIDGEETAVLSGIDLSVAPGEVLGVVGESGCGKSTLAGALIRLLPPNGRITAGTIELGGQNLMALNDDAMRGIRGREIGVIYQDPLMSFNPTFTVGAQLQKAVEAHSGRVDRKAFRLRATEMLTRVGIPDAYERLDQYPHEFSGGMGQRIAIAMVLMLEPEIIIADEPTSALDVTLQAQILELLRELRVHRDTAMIFISHDLGVVSEIADRLSVMYAGRIVEEGDVASTFTQPRHPYTEALLASVPSYLRRRTALRSIPGRVPSLTEMPAGCRFADRCHFVKNICRETEPELLSSSGGRVRCLRHDPTSLYGSAPDGPASSSAAIGSAVKVAANVERSPTLPPESTPLVKVRNLQTLLGEGRRILRHRSGSHLAPVRAVDRVSLEIARGEIFGLVGESGAGKTTLGKTLMRLVPATGGEILFDERDLARLSGRELRRLRRRVQMIFQGPHASLSPRMRVSTLVTEPYSINRVPVSERLTVAELLGMVELSPEHGRRYPHELSGGQARRVGVARALSMGPEFVIADEPTSGLDVSAAASVLNLMKELQTKLGLSYMIITHDLNVVGYLADRIAVMYLGRLVEVAPTDLLLTRPAHPYTRGLLDAVPGLSRSMHDRDTRLLVPGEIPSPRNPPSGCRFHTRCPFARDVCHRVEPALETIEGGHVVACHFWQEIRGKFELTRTKESPFHPHRLLARD